MNSLNRQVVIIKPKAPYAAWINSLPTMLDDPVGLDSLNKDCTALLIPHCDDDNDSL